MHSHADVQADAQARALAHEGNRADTERGFGPGPIASRNLDARHIGRLHEALDFAGLICTSDGAPSILTVVAASDLISFCVKPL